LKLAYTAAQTNRKINPNRAETWYIAVTPFFDLDGQEWPLLKNLI
jgi:hypothetical protein